MFVIRKQDVFLSNYNDCITTILDEIYNVYTHKYTFGKLLSFWKSQIEMYIRKANNIFKHVTLQ